MANKTLEKITSIALAVALPALAIASSIYTSNKDLRDNGGKVTPILGLVVYDSNHDGTPDYTIQKSFLITPGTFTQIKRAPTQEEVNWYQSR